MERNIKCDESYNPYKVIDKFIELGEEYCFNISCVPHSYLKNSYTYYFDSGNLRFSISNNTAHDNYFYVGIDHAEHMGHMYKRDNLELSGDKISIIIERIKDVIHQYIEDTEEKTQRVIKINSLIDG